LLALHALLIIGVSDKLKWSFFCIFLQSYTQYIPLPITDLDSWLKTPSIYVFDCSASGIIVKAFLEVCYMLLINICFSVLEDEGHHDLWACFCFCSWIV
jgi:hypothetical protein